MAETNATTKFFIVLLAAVAAVAVVAAAFGVVRDALPARAAGQETAIVRAADTQALLADGRAEPLAQYLGSPEWEAATGLHVKELVGWDARPQSGDAFVVSFNLTTEAGHLAYEWIYDVRRGTIRPFNLAAAKIRLLAAAPPRPSF
jgi:hypothetical protein